MSEFRQKAIPGIVGVLCLFTALFLLTEGSHTYDPSQWESEELVSTEASKEGEQDIFSNERNVEVVVAPQASPSVKEEEKQELATSDSFQPVKEDSWVKHAVAELASEELPDLEGDLARDKPVTRYELAVIIARVIEKLQNQKDPQVVEATLPKIAMLEKLSVEFRKELDILGVSGRRFSARISQLEKNMTTVSRTVGALSKRVDSAEESSVQAVKESRVSQKKVDTVEGDVALLRDMLAEQDKQMKEGEKQLKNLGDIVSRLLVKVALNDAKIADATPAGAEKSRRDLGALARAVSGLQKKFSSMADKDVAQEQRLDAFSRKLEERPGAEIPPQALAEVKGLLKEFFTSYESRLRRVESRAM